MNEPQKTVVVAGATGRTGSLVVEELFQRGYKVRAIVRSAKRAFWIKDKGGEVVEADIASTDALEQAVNDACFVISALGSKKPFSSRENNVVDNMGNQNLAKAVKVKAVSRIVVISSIGVGDSKHALNFLFGLLLGPVLRMKERSEAGIKASGAEYTIIRPGGLSDKELSGEVAYGEGGKITGSVTRREIARVCVDALTNPGMKNRTFEVVDVSTLKEKFRQFIIDI
jgi:uncharacterized protein YbjT (DUF2867 family)